MDRPLDDHFEALLPRLTPARDRLRDLLSDGSATGWLQVVRYFEEGDEDFDEATYGMDEATVERGLRRFSGQHPFLGFGLGWEMLDLLHFISADIDFDEYG
jgi:hypothetical protein